MSRFGENIYENNSRPLIDENKNIKRKTIDEQDESYITSELPIIGETRPNSRSLYKEPTNINAELYYEHLRDKGLYNLKSEKKLTHNDNSFVPIKNLPHYQQHQIHDDKIPQTVESPLNENQKKKLALLNRKNPACPRRPKLISEKELHKEKSENEINSNRENRNSRNEIFIKNENINENVDENINANINANINESRIKRNKYAENIMNKGELKITQKKNNSYDFPKGEMKMSTHNNEYAYEQLENLSYNYTNKSSRNDSQKPKYTSEFSRETENEPYQGISIQNSFMKLGSSQSIEYTTSSYEHGENISRNLSKNTSAFSNILEDKKHKRILKNENTKNEMLNTSNDSVNIRKRSSFHNNLSVFNDETKDMNKDELSFVGSNKSGIGSNTNLEDIYQNKNQLKIIRSNSSNIKNEQENTVSVISRENYVTRKKGNIFKMKEHEYEHEHEPVGKAEKFSSNDFSKRDRYEKKMEINLDCSTSKNELTNFNYRKDTETIPIHKKDTNKGKQMEIKMVDAETISKNKKDEKVKILIKSNAEDKESMVEVAEEKTAHYVNYDDIPCKGMNISNDVSMIDNSFNMNYENERPANKLPVHHKKKVRTVIAKKSEHSINTSSNHSVGTSVMNNSSNNFSFSNNSSYNRLGEGRSEYSDEKCSSTSVEKTASLKKSSNRNTPSINKQTNSTNKKSNVASVTSKIKTDNVTYITFEELTEFPQVLNNDRISDMVIDIIEKSKNHDWTKQIEDLINLRRIMKFHTKIFFEEQSKDLRRIIRAVVELINSPRSCVSKNALLCLSEFYNNGKKRVDCTIDDVVLPCLKKAHQTSVDFISNAANNALLAICNACSESKLILYFIKQITSKQKTYNLLCLRCLIAVLIKFDHNVIKFKEADKLVEAILECTLVGSAEIKCTARVALVVLENACPIRKLCSKNISATQMEKIDVIIDKTSESEIDLVLGKIAVC